MAKAARGTKYVRVRPTPPLGAVLDWVVSADGKKPTLEQMQKEVGGYVEQIPLRRVSSKGRQLVALVDEEFLLRNRAATPTAIVTKTWRGVLQLYGPIVIVALARENWALLTDAEAEAVKLIDTGEGSQWLPFLDFE